jgi:hypothetical protein
MVSDEFSVLLKQQMVMKLGDERFSNYVKQDGSRNI